MLCVLAATAAFAVATAAPAISQPPAPDQSVRSPTASDESATLFDPAATEAARAEAARRLLGSTSVEARAVIEQALSSPDPAQSGPPAAAAMRAVIAEIAEMPSAPPWLLVHLARQLDDSTLDAVSRMQVIGGVASIRTRDAAKVLLEQAQAAGATAGPAREAALAGLARLSGRSEFGTDVNRWQIWFQQIQWLPEAEWRMELAEGLGARADALRAQRDRAITRLSEALRQQYLALESVAARSARLTEFLRDNQPEVRRLGLSLARQEIANARQLEPTVGEAVVGLLADSSVETRVQAAELVNILAPEGQATHVTDRLRQESDPRVAAVLLKAAARWPARDLTTVILGWLEAGPPTSSPACETIDAIERRGWLTDAHALDTTLRVLREWIMRDRAGLPPSGLRLLAVLGGPDDRARVFQMLRDSEPAIRWSAATAVSQIPDSGGGGNALDALVSAARSDPALFSLAAQSIASLRPTAAGFQMLASLPAPDPVQGRERLLALGAVLPHTELLRAARATRDVQLREAMLARLLREPLAAQRAPGSARTLKPEVIAGLLTLVDARIELGQPAGALAALDVLNAAADRIDPAVLNDRRVVVLVWLNRLEDAAKIDTGPDAWMDGIERCIGLPHASSAVAACQARFPVAWPPDAAERLRGIGFRLLQPGQP